MPLPRLTFPRNLALLPGLDLGSTRHLAAVTDDPVLIIEAAIAEARQAQQRGDDLLMRQAAEKGWLALASLGDVASLRLGMGTPHGSRKRVRALEELEELLRLWGRPYSSAFDNAHRVLHGEVFHAADRRKLALVPQRLEALREVVVEAMDRLPEAVRQQRARRRR